MKQFAILGYPLKHTLSPILHEKLSSCHDTQLGYTTLEIEPHNFSDSKSKWMTLDGFNVTIPYKILIRDYLDELDFSAQKHGAVNVVYNKNGKYIGYNTDCIGFVRCMEQAGIAIQGKVCIVGLGGAGRMFATECAYRGCTLTFVVKQSHIEDVKSKQYQDLRILKKQLEKVSNKPITIIAPEQLSGEFDLLINASPVGMYPNVEESPVNKCVLQKVKAVFDCIYNPKETRLIQQARELGCTVCNGLPMLVWQAAAAQEIWLNTVFQKKQVDQVLSEMEDVL